MKLKRWLIEKFLPAWCREELLEENKRVWELCEMQKKTIGNQKAYIRGMERALRSRMNIYIERGIEE